MDRLIKNIIRSILGFFLTAILVYFLFQVLEFFQTATDASEFSQLSRFKFNIFKVFDDSNILRYWITVGASITVACLALLNFGTVNSNGQSQRFFKTKYERENMNKILTFRERKRGSFRVMYDLKGEITRRRLEVLTDYIKYPFVRAYNNRLTFYLRPEPSKLFDGTKQYTINGNKQYHKGGIPFAAFRSAYLFGKFNKIYYLSTGVHSAFVGMTGRGKSLTFVMPMIQSFIDAGESMVIHDVKEELYAHSKEQLIKAGYEVIEINFNNPEKGQGWNPFAMPTKYWFEEMKKVEAKVSKDNSDDPSNPNMSTPVEMVLDIANTIAFEENAKEAFWWEGAASMIAGGALLLLEEGNPEMVNASSIKHIYDVGNDSDKRTGTTIYKYLDKFRTELNDSTKKIGTYLNSEGVTKSSLMSVFNNKMDMMTSTQNIREMTSVSTFDMEEVFKKKTAIFLITQDEKSTYYPLVTMFFKQLYEVAIRVSRDLPGRKLPVPMHWLIDEFGTLPEIKDIENIYAAARSRGISIHIFFQTLAQLENKYEGDAKTILDNIDNLIYLGSGTPEVKAEIVKRVGVEKYWNKDKKEYDERPLLTEERLNSLEKGRAILTSMEWGTYVIKLPPFNKYATYRKPVWHIDEVKKPKVQMFNIKKAYNAKLNNENPKVKSKSFDDINDEAKYMIGNN